MARRRPQLPSWNEIMGMPADSFEEEKGRDLNARLAWDQDAIQEQEGDNPDSDFEVQMPKDIEDIGTQIATAPTINPNRPRAHAIGYNPTTRTLVVIFRDNTWWQYENVPVDLWLGLRSAPSTGRFLRESGLDSWTDMGPAQLKNISAATLAQFSSVAASASRIQRGTTI